ncbi:MAG: TetR/AcrR family transcriptional regulator [bacterium]|nr:TetR/AcrR family transcriptional regulator [bacterium]
MPVATVQPESASTRDRLRHAAAELFAARGYVGASMSDIAKRVGVRKPSLYNYYSSKEELFMDLLKSSIDDWLAVSQPPLDAEGTCCERLRGHLRKTVEFTEESPHAVVICRMAVTQLAGDLGERVHALLADHRQDYQGRLDTFFASAIAAGEVLPAPPAALVLSWLTFLDGVMFHQLFATGSRGSTYRDHLDELWQLFWRGIAARPEMEDLPFA